MFDFMSPSDNRGLSLCAGNPALYIVLQVLPVVIPEDRTRDKF